ncbi:IS4 family transposase [Neobacillus sp. NPDC093127]|uniref:IS4 family transposase n=1 Tax=Neobacillus sp. NPDC093127 TaxID=3364296 RepID=UPI00380A09E8
MVVRPWDPHFENHLTISEEGLNQRFSTKAVCFLRELLCRLVQSRFSKRDQPLLSRCSFSRIRILDSTAFSLPMQFLEGYAGPTSSGVKVQWEYDLLSGDFLYGGVREGNENDASYAKETIGNIMPDDLFIRDLGYFSTKFLEEADQRGAFYVTRFKSNMKIFRKENGVFHELDPVQLGEKLLPGESLELLDIYLGAERQYIPRLSIHCLTEEQAVRRQRKQKWVQKKKGKALTSRTLQKQAYNYLFTNIPQEEISPQDLYLLYSLRWQVEILFKTWKSHFHLDKVKKMKKERFECHLYGVLIAIWISMRFTFQARLYLYKKKDMELSEFKTMGIIREILPQMILAQTDRMVLIHQFYTILIRHGKKARKKGKPTELDILKMLGII